MSPDRARSRLGARPWHPQKRKTLEPIGRNWMPSLRRRKASPDRPHVRCCHEWVWGSKHVTPCRRAELFGS